MSASIGDRALIPDTITMKIKLRQKWSRFLWTAVIAMGIIGIGTVAFKQVPSQTAFFPSQPSAAIAETLPSELRQVKSFRSPTCGCCSAWVEHMEQAGFEVEDNVTSDMAEIKQQQNIPDDLAACHTAIVGNYVVEGHIPASAVQRLLIEQPKVNGIAVPGMPIGSPGMESGNIKEPYQVLTFDKSGNTSVFAEYL